MRKVVLGLGNPEEKYAPTRHNLGWRVVEALALKEGRKFRKEGFEFWAAEARPGTTKVMLVKTWTYVNGTGRVVPELEKRYGGEILAVCDDVALPLGRLRIRAQGSSGGHNGLESIIEILGHDRFARLRIGVGGGKPDPRYVLGRFREAELPVVNEAVQEACKAVACWADEGVDLCMTRFNRRTESENV